VIFIQTALFCEAKPFIEQLSLKKNTRIHEFPVYENPDISLIISGAGKIKAAIATVFLLKNRSNKGDFFINIGMCGTFAKDIKTGAIIYLSKIIDLDTERTYFPEMLWKHHFIEGTLATSSKVITKMPEDVLWDFVDMEASGVYEATSFFLPLSSIIFLKVVSDNLTDPNHDKITEEFIKDLIQKKSGLIMDFIKKIQESNQIKDNHDILSEEELSLLNTISERLRLTTTMTIEIKKYALYFKRNNGSLTDVLSPFLEKSVKSKYEAKKEYNLLKNVLSQ